MGWIQSKRYPFTEENVTKAPIEEGVYGIMTSDDKMIYIGQGKLRNRLTTHYNNQDPADACIRKYSPTHYYREVCSNPESREKELLSTYSTYCNKKIG